MNTQGEAEGCPIPALVGVTITTTGKQLCELSPCLDIMVMGGQVQSRA